MKDDILGTLGVSLGVEKENVNLNTLATKGISQIYEKLNAKISKEGNLITDDSGVWSKYFGADSKLIQVMGNNG
jgi:hypothetical protein